MNLVDIYTKPIINSSEKNIRNSFKENDKTEYNDPLRKWPLKGLAYSNELGAVVSGISPKLGTALWIPALMYFGADIYDKYKNDETQYSPSKRRGLKEAIFQAMASVVLPTAAVKSGQKILSLLGLATKTGLSIQNRQTVIEKSLSYMQTKSLHTFENDKNPYIDGFKNAISTMASDLQGDFKALPKSKKLLKLINPMNNFDSIAFANPQRLSEFSEKQAKNVLEMREKLMQNEKPQQLSKKLFKKFLNIQDEYNKIYPQDRYLGKAAKSILKEYHQTQIFKNKMIKTAGGFIALALLLKPIDNFVEHIVIKKTVEPGLDYFSKSLKKE